MMAHPLDHEFLTIMGCLHEAYDPADPAEHYHVEEAWSCLKRLASEIGWPWDGDAKLSSTTETFTDLRSALETTPDTALTVAQRVEAAEGPDRVCPIDPTRACNCHRRPTNCPRTSPHYKLFLRTLESEHG